MSSMRSGELPAKPAPVTPPTCIPSDPPGFSISRQSTRAESKVVVGLVMGEVKI
jgi:hypothetical protein